MSKRSVTLAFLLTTMVAPGAIAGNFQLLPAARQAADKQATESQPIQTPVTESRIGDVEAKPASSLLTDRLPAATTAGAATSLLPFEQAADRLELTGEDDTTQLSFHMGAGQLAAGGVLQIAYQNAVSVLPDTGVVDVMVNGQSAGSFPIRSPNGVKIETLTVPATALKAGRNDVRIRARQHHRVDCSIDATYELWTRFDPARSGFLAGSPVTFSTLDDLMAVGKTASGMTEIRLVTAEGGAAMAANDSVAVIQALGLLLDRDDILVTAGPQAGTGPGIDLYVGSGTETSQTDDGRRMLAGAPGGLSVRAGKVPGRAAVTLQGGTATERSASLLTAVRGPMRAGLESGVFAKRWGGLDGEASRTYTLRDAGYVTAPFVGRLARTHFDLAMPADFYPAEYDTMNFYLHGATTPGLALGAQLLVRVNDRVVTSLPFRNTRGEQFDRKRIELPLRAFRPGVNRVDILAELPVAADAVCQPQAVAENKPRFILLDDSTLEIPALARIGRLPDLGAFSGAAYPFGDGKPFDVFVDNPDSRAMASALTAVVHLSLAARKPLGAEIHLAQPTEKEGRNALIISTSPAVASVGRAAALPAQTSDDLLAGFAAPAQATDPVNTAALDQAVVLPAGNADALLNAFQESTTTIVEGDASVTSRAQAWVVGAISRFGHWLNYEDPTLASYGAGDAGALLTLSQAQSPSGTANWTMIRSDSAENLALAMAKLAQPAVWSSLEGGSASIRADNGTLVSQPATARVITEITDPSFGNVRRLAASWFSDNFQIYVVLVILLMGGFGAWLGFAVPRKGVRTDQ